MPDFAVTFTAYVNHKLAPEGFPDSFEELPEVRHRCFLSSSSRGVRGYLGPWAGLHPGSRQAPCGPAAGRFQPYHSTALTRVAVAEIGVRIITHGYEEA